MRPGNGSDFPVVEYGTWGESSCSSISDRLPGDAAPAQRRDLAQAGSSAETRSVAVCTESSARPSTNRPPAAVAAQALEHSHAGNEEAAAEQHQPEHDPEQRRARPRGRRGQHHLDGPGVSGRREAPAPRSHRPGPVSARERERGEEQRAEERRRQQQRRRPEPELEKPAEPPPLGMGGIGVDGHRPAEGQPHHVIAAGWDPQLLSALAEVDHQRVRRAQPAQAALGARPAAQHRQLRRDHRAGQPAARDHSAAEREQDRRLDCRVHGSHATRPHEARATLSAPCGDWPQPLRDRAGETPSLTSTAARPAPAAAPNPCGSAAAQSR